ncbi:DNA cytosine methyltransferase [Dysosmobacter sp.]|uniref:DNA cytosine methyltransferase n=1 Tax=Dysosmobacter sp. TaxID=2591382 RepID=UPI002F9241BA
MKLNTTLTLGSLFDGSGGFPLGGLLAGITPVWASEIEPFPIRVTTKRLPFMKHYGDISQMDGGKIEPVDIITFGSPCTDMSIAGRRAGLDGKQSSLFYQAIRIIQEMREATHGRYPRYIVWENVPGAFSSNKGEDFKAVLEAVIGIKEPGAQVPMPEKNLWPYADLYLGEQWSVAYRTLDAQYWGVPQRRRRIYLVADFAGWGAGQVLFESEGLSGYSAEGFRAWQRAAGDSAVGAGAAGVCLNDQGGSCMDVSSEVAATLRAENHGHPPCVLDAAGFCTEHSADSRGIGFEQERAPTLRAGVVPAAIALESHPIDSRIKIADDGTIQTLTSRMGTGGMNVPLVLKIRSGCEGGGKGPLIQEDRSATLSCNNDQTLFEPVPFGICSDQSKAMLSDNPHAGIYKAQTSRTLDTGGGNPGCNQGGIAVVAREKSYAMTMNSYVQVEEEKTPALLSRDYKDPTAVNSGYTVRRLTPTECARLQGFPDWWCSGLDTPEPTGEDIAFWTEVWETHRRLCNPSVKPKTERQIVKWLRSPHSDAAEYKMWGNGVALPCVWFVLSGIVFSTQLSPA